jgi:hypothetical protein
MGLIGKMLVICGMLTAALLLHFTDPIPPQTAPEAQEQPQVIEQEESSQPASESFSEAEYAPNAGFVEYPGVYLDNYTGQSADHLLQSGRHVYYYGNTEFPSSQIYQQDAYKAYCIYKTMTFTRLRGFPNSRYCDYEVAKHFVVTLVDNGRSFEVGLAILELESTYGLADGNNDFGILDKNYNDGSPEGYCGFLNEYCGARDEMDWIMHGGYNESVDYHQNVLNLSSQIKGEMY